MADYYSVIQRNVLILPFKQSYSTCFIVVFYLKYRTPKSLPQKFSGLNPGLTSQRTSFPFSTPTQEHAQVSIRPLQKMRGLCLTHRSPSIPLPLLREGSLPKSRNNSFVHKPREILAQIHSCGFYSAWLGLTGLPYK